MQNGLEKTYWSKEVADLLGIGTSTLRKWCLQLERDGYIFLRDEHERRAYTEHDALALRKFKEYTTNGMTLENASNAVIASFNRDKNTSVTPSARPPLMRSEERYELMEQKIDQLLEYIQKQDHFNQILLERLKKQDEIIEGLKERNEVAAAQVLIGESTERLAERVQTLSDQVELTSQAIETMINETRVERHKKKGFFGKFFG